MRISVYRQNEMPESSRAAMKLRELSHKWGVRIEMNMVHPTYKTQPYKTVYSLRERKHYRPEMNKVISKYFFNANQDPYPKEEIEKYKKLYGDKALVLGETEDTKWMKNGRPNIPTN